MLWDRVMSAHYTGAPYSNGFVAAFQTMWVDRPYDGPEGAAYDLHEKQMLKEI